MACLTQRYPELSTEIALRKEQIREGHHMGRDVAALDRGQTGIHLWADRGGCTSVGRPSAGVSGKAHPDNRPECRRRRERCSGADHGAEASGPVRQAGRRRKPARSGRRHRNRRRSKGRARRPHARHGLYLADAEACSLQDLALRSAAGCHIDRPACCPAYDHRLAA